ncbi:MAG TPA: hypothetical protein VF039_04330 [Longimicrobiales bacterium]
MIRLFSFPVLWIWTLATATGVAVAGALPHPTPVREPTKRQAVLRFAGFALAALSLAAVVWFGSVIGSVYLWDRGEGEVHILPDGFEGPVLILYDQPDGLPARYDDDGRRLFEIPRSGVMRTRMEPNDGWVSYAMYYRTTDGSLAPIHFAGNPCDDRPILQVCLMGLEMRSSVPNPPEYLAYVVARGDEIETAWASGDALVDSLVFRPYEPTVPAEPARHLTTQTEKKDAAQ